MHARTYKDSTRPGTPSRRGQLAVAPEMTLIEYLDCVLLLGRPVSREHHLLRSGTHMSHPERTQRSAERTVEYEPSPSTRPNSKSSAVVATRPFTELLRDWERFREDGGRNSEAPSSRSSERPSSRARYAGGRDVRGVLGDWGLRERTAVRGDENVRRGRGRTGVWRVRSEVELEELLEDMTEAFLLRSARVGVVWSEDVSGDGDETWILSMRGWEKRRRRERQDGRARRRERRISFGYVAN